MTGVESFRNGLQSTENQVRTASAPQCGQLNAVSRMEGATDFIEMLLLCQ